MASLGTSEARKRETRTALAARAGIGLRAAHLAEILARRPPIDFLEIHAENYMGGGPRLRALESLRTDYALSIHGVGLSLGSAEGVDSTHLARFKMLVDRFEPALVSEHLAWSVEGGIYLNDLMPLPYDEESLDVVARNIEWVQATLGRRILVENPSSYLRYRRSTIPEAEFIAALVRRTGCGLLCDVNNIHVTARNLGLDAEAYLAALPMDAVGEIHLAGHRVNRFGNAMLLVDDHGSAVSPAVWALYRRALQRFGPVPTLVEWDTALPTLDALLREADEADRIAAEALAGWAHAEPA